MPRDLLAQPPRDLLAGSEPKSEPNKLVGAAKTYLKEGQKGMKLLAVRPDVAFGFNKDISPEQFEQTEKPWLDVLKEAYPSLGEYPAGDKTLLKGEGVKYATQFTKEFLAGMAADLLEFGTKPSSWATMYGVQQAGPKLASGVFKKLPKGWQDALLRERHVWGKSPIDKAYRELGLKSGASVADVKAAWRSAALKTHPDRAPQGQAVKYTRDFIRKRSAYERILSEMKGKQPIEPVLKTKPSTTQTKGVPTLKVDAKKSYTPTEFHALPLDQQEAVLASKLAGAKGAKHRASIEKKYQITSSEEVPKPDTVNEVKSAVTERLERVVERWESGEMGKSEQNRKVYERAKEMLSRGVGQEAPKGGVLKTVEKIAEDMAGYFRTDFKKGSVSGYPPYWTSAGEELGTPLRKRDFFGTKGSKGTRAQKGIFARVREGLPLTETQQQKLDVLMNHYRRDIDAIKPTGEKKPDIHQDLWDEEIEQVEINRSPSTTESTFTSPLSEKPIEAPPPPAQIDAPKPKPLTTWKVEDFSDNALINKSDPSTSRIIERINERTRKKMIKSVELHKAGKNPYGINHLLDTPIAFQMFEENTGFPLYSKYHNQFSPARNTVAHEVSGIVNKFTEGLKKGFHNPESTERIVNWITKRKVALNAEEMTIAKKLQDVFRETKDVVSYLRMRRYIDGIEAVPEQFSAQVMEGEKVFSEKGARALEEWVKGKDIGVIKDDRYFPAQLLYKFRAHSSADPFDVFNPHLHSRESKVQMYDYSQSLVQKLHSYLTRIYSDYYMYDTLKEISADFSGSTIPYDTLDAVKNWLLAIQGRGVNVGWWGRLARKGRGQFFKVTLADPTKWVRNWFQRYYMTLSHYPTLQHAIRTGRYVGYKLTDSEIDYFNKHVSQLGELEREQLYLYEKFFENGMLGRVDDLAVKIAHRYTLIDQGNRWTTFKYALASNDTYFKLYKEGKLNLNGLLTKTGLSGFYDLELKHILSLPLEEARLEAARLMVEKTQFRYKKVERGLGSLSEFGEIGTSLLQYPKGVLTAYMDGVDMLARGDSWSERWNGARLLVGLVLLSSAAQQLLQLTTGESRYYDPDLGREVEHDPYSLVGVIGSLGIAGAQPAHAMTLARINKRIVNLLYFESTGQLSEKERLTSIRAILKDVDTLGESYIPFLKIVMNVVESAEGTRSHKLLTTWFDQRTKRWSALRRNRIERDWIEKLIHGIFGREKRGQK